jgi:hypothetical protein
LRMILICRSALLTASRLAEVSVLKACEEMVLCMGY